ncbi:hypothetical protein LINPERHAP1_LOCUS6994 [Linum perenne]
MAAAVLDTEEEMVEVFVAEKAEDRRVSDISAYSQEDN